MDLWVRWVAANALAEVVGLGATFGVGALVVSALGDRSGSLASLLTILLMTLSGAIEGTVVGLLQWSVLRSAFSRIARGAWVTATLIGALVAWFLGSLPSTVMSLEGTGSGAGMEAPPAWAMLGLAGIMGLFLGLILGAPQWRVLRREVRGACWIWLPANAVAWSLGMPLIFAGVDWVMATGSLGAGLALSVGVLALAGSVVGAVHGSALVWLRNSSRERGYV